MLVQRGKKAKLAEKTKKSLEADGFIVLSRRASQMLLSDCEPLYKDVLNRSLLENKVICIFDEFDRALPEVKDFILNRWNLSRVLICDRTKLK